MRILFYSHTGKVNGAEQVLLLLLKLLDREIFAPTLLCPSGGGLAERARGLGVPVTTMDELDARLTLRPDRFIQSLISFARVIRKMRGEVRANSIDAVHANGIRAGLVASAATLGTGKPVFWHLHDELRPHPISTAIRLFAAFFPNINLISVSGATLDAFRGKVLGRKVPAAVVHNTVELERFAGGDGDRERVRKELGIAADEFVLGIVGRITPLKGQLELIETLPSVLERIPGTKLLIVGQPMFGSAEEEYLVTLRESVKRLGLEEKVKFLGQRDDVPALMRAFDTLVVNSSTEALVLVVLEGMACGTPVIATDVGGTREMIEDGVNGRLLRFGDSRQLADAIVGLGSDQALRCVFSEKGRETVSSRFGTGRFIANIQKILLNGLRANQIGNPVAADKRLLRDN